MRLRRVLLFTLVATGTTWPALAQNFWIEKEFRRWTEKECRQLLEDSPWAKSFTHSQTYIEVMGARTRERELQSIPKFHYVAQIRSALPVRQALVRQRQLEARYDQMNPRQKQAFDRQAQEFLSLESPDAVVIYVSYSTNVVTFYRELARHWQSLPTEQARKEIQLLGPRGKRIYPLTYAVPEGTDGAFEVSFPKIVEGEPLLTPEDKELRLLLVHPDIGQQGSANIYFHFDVRKMLINGKVVY